MRTPLIDGKVPGQFKARCALTRPHPVKDLPEYLRREYEVRGWKRATRGIYSRKLRREASVECYLEPLCDGFETTDRGVFEDHMRTVHGKKPATGENAALMSRAQGTWRGPRLTEDGKPWSADDERTEICDGCGLVAQVGYTNEFEQWWREHLEFCAERGAA